jgi:hypothetical protein
MTVKLLSGPSKKFLLFLITISAIFNFCFLEYNNYIIRKHNPGNIEINTASLVHGQTIYSIDNEYYLSPVDNYLAGKGWKRGAAVGDGDYVRRVPGYSLVYLAFVEAFGRSSGHLFLKIFQLLLFLSTIPVIFYLCRVVAAELPARLVTIIYAFIPFVSSWAYFTLTESLSPFLTIFYVYFALKGIRSENEKEKIKFYAWSSFFFIAAVLTRPYIALAGIILFVFSARDFLFKGISSKRVLQFFLVWLVPVLLLGGWAIRNYMLTKELVLFEEAYHPQSLDRMKPEFRGMFTFTKSWGEDGAKFTRYHEPFFWPAIAGDTNSAPIQNIIKSWPSYIVEKFGYDRLYQTLKDHQSVLVSYKPYYESRSAMPDHWTDQQLKVEAEYKNLEKEFRQANAMKYWVTARLAYLKRMIFHSNTPNIFLFQKEAGMPGWVYLYKVFLFALHVLFYLALFLNIFLVKGWINRLVFVYTPLLFVVFICFIHREVEARYMLPVLPLLIAGSAVTADRLLSATKQIFGKQKLSIVPDAT